MKKLLLLASLLLMLAACDNATGPSGGASLQTHPYFPFSVGDEYVWQVTDHNNDSIYTRTWKVTTAQKIDSHFYYVHVSDEYWHEDIKVGQGPAMRRDTSMYRVQGDSIFFRNGSYEGLTVDFSRNYQPNGGSTFLYVKDTTDVIVPAGLFNGKIMRGEYGRHIYAPGLGMIYSEFIFGVYKPIEIKLLSAKIGGRSYP